MYSRQLKWFHTNATNYQEFNDMQSLADGRLKPASDVDVNGVITTLVFNAIVFIVLMLSYEILHRMIPTVYASKHRRELMSKFTSELPDIFDSLAPLEWVGPVFGIPWAQVRKEGGLDAYFFLRYIRMCFRITSVFSFWSIIVLWPIYITGKNNAAGWYHISMANVSQGSWRIWVPTLFMYVFSAFVFFVMRQEYRHYLELRLDFLGKGGIRVHPQHHYSLLVEHIPEMLRSDMALFDYFNLLFPGRVHSASVVLNVPELDEASRKIFKVCRRLEKSIAYYYATGRRPTHIVGRPRCMCCGIEGKPFEIPFLECGQVIDMENETDELHRGDRVDSITYYSHDLRLLHRYMAELQRRNLQVAQTGNVSVRAKTWFAWVADMAGEASLKYSIKDEGIEKSTGRSTRQILDPTYGAMNRFNLSRSISRKNGQPLVGDDSAEDSDFHQTSVSRQNDQPLMGDDSAEDSDFRQTSYQLQFSESIDDIDDTPIDNEHETELDWCSLIAARLGLDFLMTGVKVVNRQLDDVVASVEQSDMSSMSSTGFVTFFDLKSLTFAASAPLTHKANSLQVSVASEARDLIWENVPYSSAGNKQRESNANLLLALGALLWSIPLASIQAIASAEKVAKIPGMEWILTYDSGSLKLLINSYLPVVMLLTLIMLLPIIFEWVAIYYEKRKTRSDVQRSIVGRYFYYQLANIYITVSAGSLWRSASDILDHPSAVLETLGNTLPTVVGYFISLLITKILSGLPLVILRVGSLFRFIFLRLSYKEKYLTQRELNEVYKVEALNYGYEYPTQLLVIVICFTYACISPVILIVGALYFIGALMVYKKQVLYVYTPQYESGGLLFPLVCDRTIFGLFCGQLTFIGYSLIRGGFFQPIAILPLLYFSFWMMNYFKVHYAETSKKLSLERTIELDRMLDKKASEDSIEVRPGSGDRLLSNIFSASYYKQPLLTEKLGEPFFHRRGLKDPLTKEVKDKLRRDQSQQLNGGRSNDSSDAEIPAGEFSMIHNNIGVTV